MANQIRRTLVLVIVVCFVSAPITLADNEDQIALSQPLTIVWKYQTNDIADLTPASDGREIFLPLGAGVLVSLSGADGKLHWRAEVGGEFSAAPAADDRAVYVAGRYADPDQKQVHGTLRALSKSTGVTLWMRTLPTPLTGALVDAGTTLFASTADGYVYAFNRLTGLVQWRNDYNDEFAGGPTLAGNRLYVGGKSGIVRAFDANTGQLVWQYKTGGAVSSPIAMKDSVAYFGSDDGNVYAFSEIRSKPLWHRRTGAAVRAVVAGEEFHV